MLKLPIQLSLAPKQTLHDTSIIVHVRVTIIIIMNMCSDCITSTVHTMSYVIWVHINVNLQALIIKMQGWNVNDEQVDSEELPAVLKHKQQIQKAERPG